MSALPIVPLADLVAELRAMHSIPCLTAADRLEEYGRAVDAIVAWADWTWTREGEGEGKLLALRYHEALDYLRSIR